eukprot:878293-Pleurochrysis_carterae.AAC.1
MLPLAAAPAAAASIREVRHPRQRRCGHATYMHAALREAANFANGAAYEVHTSGLSTALTFKDDEIYNKRVKCAIVIY